MVIDIPKAATYSSFLIQVDPVSIDYGSHTRIHVCIDMIHPCIHKCMSFSIYRTCTVICIETCINQSICIVCTNSYVTHYSKHIHTYIKTSVLYMYIHNTGITLVQFVSNSVSKSQIMRLRLRFQSYIHDICPRLFVYVFLMHYE